MSDESSGKAERLARTAEVRDALEQAGAATPPKAELPRRDAAYLLGCALVVVLLIALRQATDLGLPAFLEGWRDGIRRVAGAGAVTALLLAFTRAVDAWLLSRVRDRAARYDLSRVLRLVTILTIAVVALSALFADWTAAAMSLGLLSLVLGFALQTPITSFIGWIYILLRRPYRVGDRIKIANVAGDVIDVGYFDTTLWEFGGEYLSTDHPSGRIVKLPNSLVLKEPVYNYSWPLFPYIWNEVKVQLAYESDLDLVAKILQEVAEAEVGKDMQEHVGAYRQILARTAVDQLDVKDRPVVFFRVNELAWLDGIVRYLVHPRQAGGVKSRMTRSLLARLNEHPDRVLFPKGPAR